MRLGDFLKARDIAVAEAAVVLAVSRPALYRLMNGQVPKRDLGRRIFVWSDGLVRPDDFYDLPALQGADGAPLTPTLSHEGRGGAARAGVAA